MDPQHLTDPPETALDRAFSELVQSSHKAVALLEDFELYGYADDLQASLAKVEALLYPDSK